MASITLDEIFASAEAQYQPLDINLGPAGILKLRNPLRMSKEERAELQALFSQDESEGEQEDRDEAEHLRQMISIVAADKELAEAFVKRPQVDLAVLANIVKRYTEAVKPGEA